MSYTAQFTKQKGLKILDENEEINSSFSSIRNETNFFSIKIKQPTLFIDKFQNKKTLSIDLKETDTIAKYSDLQRMGYLIITQKINPKSAWFKGQRVFFKLFPTHKRYALNNKDCAVYNSIPRHLFVRYDYIHKLIRLEDKDKGKRRYRHFTTSPLGYGDWYEVKEC